MKHIKDGVEAKGITLELIDGLIEAALVLHRFDYLFYVTSLSDGKHMSMSLHYSGRAADVRTRHMRVQDVPEVVRALKESLGPAWDVVLEKDHIHMEYDPK